MAFTRILCFTMRPAARNGRGILGGQARAVASPIRKVPPTAHHPTHHLCVKRGTVVADQASLCASGKFGVGAALADEAGWQPWLRRLPPCHWLCCRCFKTGGSPKFLTYTTTLLRPGGGHPGEPLGYPGPACALPQAGRFQTWTHPLEAMLQMLDHTRTPGSVEQIMATTLMLVRSTGSPEHGLAQLLLRVPGGADVCSICGAISYMQIRRLQKSTNRIACLHTFCSFSTRPRQQTLSQRHSITLYPKHVRLYSGPIQV